jgi:nitrite reductase/ring-hydroxylating ferredoxin subunit
MCVTAQNALQRPAVPRPTVQDMLDVETRPVPAVLRCIGTKRVPTAPIDRQRYVGRDFFDREMQRLWRRAWQMACRLEDIPDVGDYVVYEIGELSFLIVRTAPDTVRAYYNACLHRGRLLRESDGHAEEFRCPFHGFTWHIDGRCKRLVNGWDFDHVDVDQFRLPEARVAIWGGFVFINPAPDCEPLEAFLEDIPAAYATRGWSLADRVKVVHVQKVNRCNWKVALEAFIESFHVSETHRGAMPYLGDAHTQYDVWPGKRHTRMISPRGLHSPNMAPISDVEVYRAGMRPLLGEKAVTLELPPGMTPRAALLAAGIDVAEATDCELLDTIQYHIFPNLVCWAGWGSYLVYRFRPDGRDVDSSIMDIMFVAPQPAGASPAVAREPQRIGPDGSHHEAPQLGGYSAVFDEDSGNLAALQRGLKTMNTTGPVVGAYQEARIRHFHRMLDEFMADG